MKRMNKYVAVVMAMVLSMVMCAVGVSADSIFDTKEELKSGSQNTFKHKDKESAVYKLVISKSGIVTINYTTEAAYLDIRLFNSSGSEVTIVDNDVKAGESYSGGKGDSYVKNRWNDKSYIGTAVVTWEVEKGIYYLKIHPDYSGLPYDPSTSFTATFPSGKITASSNTTANNTSIRLYMEVGDKIDLGAVNNGKNVSSASWSSSNSKIAKVSSKGKITAVKSGKCTITWKSGSTSFTVYVEVE